jgi:hypothetical protein
MSVMTAVIKRGLRRWTKIFHFTNRRTNAHNHAESTVRDACQRAVNEPILRGERFSGFSALRFSR